MMRKYRGIVCEKQETYFVFLTTEGEFLRGKPVAGNPSIGDEVEFTLLQPSTSRLRKKWKPFFLAPALVAAVLLVVFVASMIPESEKAYAYVQLEGVDSIELGVDEEGNVITLRSLDEAQTEIGAEWIGLPIAVVLTQAVQEISPKEEVVITTIYEKEDKKELKQTIEKAVSEAQQINTEKPVQLEKSTKEERSKAIEKQKSIQQYKKQNAPPVDKSKQEKKPDAQMKKQHSPAQNKGEKKEKPVNKSEKKHEKKQEKKQEKNPHKNNEPGKGKDKNKKDHPPKGKNNGKPHNKE